MYRDKLRSKGNIVSAVELFMMFLLLLVVIVVITMVCETTRGQSLEAGSLTDAVICAENAAEVTATAEDAGSAGELISLMDGVTDVEVSGDTVTARQDGYIIEVTLTPEEGSAGTYIDEVINIYAADEAPVYMLHTGSYIREEKR